jgi:hypothetical protein
VKLIRNRPIPALHEAKIKHCYLSKQGVPGGNYKACFRTKEIYTLKKSNFSDKRQKFRKIAPFIIPDFHIVFQI